MTYQGYLKNNVPWIVQRHADGKTPREIAEELYYTVGVRSPYDGQFDDKPNDSIRSFNGIIRKLILKIPNKKQQHLRHRDETEDVGC